MKRSFTPFLLSIMLGVSLIMAGSFSNAQAALLTFEFNGNVSSVGPSFLTPLFPTFNTMQNLSGTFTFDDATGGTGVPGMTQYANALTNLSFNVGTYNFTLGPTSGITVFDDYLGVADGYNFTTGNPVGADVGGFTPTLFDIMLMAPSSAGIVNSMDLPGVPPDPTSTPFAINQWRLAFSDGSVVQGMITNTKLVPLPSALLLFGSGLIGLIGLGAGRRRETAA